VRPLATLRGLLGSPRWVVGGLLGMAGWAMHIGALARAPLSLVQAFVSGGLILAVPMAGALLGHLPLPRERWGLVGLAAALAMLATGSANRPGSIQAAGLGAYLALSTLVAAAVSALPATRRSGPILGLAGGILYGAADMAIKALTIVAHARGPGAILTSPWLLATILTTVGAFFCFQRGLQLGRPLPVIGLMTAATNIVSIVGGLLLLGDPLGATPAAGALHVLAFVVVVVAAWWLAPTQAALATGRDERTPIRAVAEGRR
jgi:drug/metabolite transporter (DMT)-like permease